jgi:hypothetical protein
MWTANELEQPRAQQFDLGSQLGVRGAVGTGLRTHNEIDCRTGARATHHVEHPDATQLAQAPFESIALDRRVSVFRNHKTNPRHGAGRKYHSHIEIGCAETLAVPHGRAQFAAARQPMTPLEAMIRTRRRRLRRRRTSTGVAP